MWNPWNQVKQAIDQINHAVSDAFGRVGRFAQDRINDVQRAAQEAVHTIEREAQKGVGTVKNEAQNALGQIEKRANELVKNIEAGGAQVAREVEKAGAEATQTVQSELVKVPHLVQSEIPHALQNGLEQAGRELTKIAFHEALPKMHSAAVKMKALLDQAKRDPTFFESAINGVSFRLNISAVTITWGNFYERAEEIISALEHYTQNKPEFNRSSVISFLKGVSASTVSLDVSFEAFTSVISGGVGIDLPQDLGLLAADEILKAAGVPE